LTSGLLGTCYRRIVPHLGAVPGAGAGADGAGSRLTLDSQITSTNGLFISSVQSTCQGTGNDGPFLYKIIPGTANSASGDFQMALHINNMNVLNGAVAGLMARLYTSPNHAAGPGGAENHVNYWK